MQTALQHRQPALLVKVALGKAAQDGPDDVAEFKLVLVLEEGELAAKLDHKVVKVLGPRVVGPTLVSLYRENVEEELEGVLALKCLLHIDFTEVVDPPESGKE